MNKPTTLCLVVMVYNNEDVIQDLLESVEKYIDYWVIVDNAGGSSDDTEEIVRLWRSGSGIPGQYLQYDQPFHSGNKRTFAVQHASEKAEYLLIMDADNTLEVTGDPFYDLDPTAAYLITKKCGGVEYPVVSLLRGDLLWKYTGIIHEFAELEGGEHFEQKLLPGVIIHEPEKIMGEGPGQRSVNHYYNHALLLEREVLDHPELPAYLKARYTFYLAQSYRDCGAIPRAIEAYEWRVNMGGWEEEVYYSMLQIVRLKKVQMEPVLNVLMASIRAWDYRPQRREGAYELMRIFMGLRLHRLALFTGKETAKLPCQDMLFVEDDTKFQELLQELQPSMAEK